jgi:hypothetical protein
LHEPIVRATASSPTANADGPCTATSLRDAGPGPKETAEVNHPYIPGIGRYRQYRALQRLLRWGQDSVRNMNMSLLGRVDPADVLPPGHQLGMQVPKGGSMCANCEYLTSATTCGNEGYQRWNGSPVLPNPADEYCCDLYEEAD